MRPSDPVVAKLQGCHFFYGDSVFDCVELPNEEDVASRFRGATWDPDVAIITARPPVVPEDRATISSSELAALAKGAIAIAVGAWDDEGAIFWEPPQPA